MIDPVERVRELDPVNRDTLRVSPELAARALQPPRERRASRRRAWLALAPIAVAATIALVLVVQGGSVDLAGRAYAAMSGEGVIHWRTVVTNPGGLRQTTEGWATDDETHVLDYDVIAGQPSLTSDTRTADGRQTMWTAVAQDVTSGPARTTATSIIPNGDPARAFRDAYRDGTLQKVDDTTYRAELGPGITATYTLHEGSGLPERLVLHADPPAFSQGNTASGETVIQFTTYEVLDATAANRKRLQMSPHPRQGDRAPADSFAALRGSRVPSTTDRERLATVVRGLDADSRFGISVSEIRELADGAWLLPGRRHVCLAVVSGPTSGAPIATACATTSRAVQRGLAVEAGATTIALPDGVRAVRITLTDGRTTTIRSNTGLLRVPEQAIRYALARSPAP